MEIPKFTLHILSELEQQEVKNRLGSLKGVLDVKAFYGVYSDEIEAIVDKKVRPEFIYSGLAIKLDPSLSPDEKKQAILSLRPEIYLSHQDGYELLYFGHF